ncbi:MAG: hypothetical protein KatS3mg043_0755 [Rhodothermaceae bacterium]|nr:MAG: hypothetical protein KatS3mg043_0755 [Rhodothermaceae bacterium]
MIDLLINIDHIATLRNARRETFPDPVHAAALCEAAGADGIVFHLREDRRHITDRDVRLLRETVQGKLDFELSTNPEVVEICCATQPDLATLVPERREEVTTEGGLDVLAERPRLRALIPRLYDAGIPEVALFVDPNPDQVEAAREVGANAIELHTGRLRQRADVRGPACRGRAPGRRRRAGPCPRPPHPRRTRPQLQQLRPVQAHRAARSGGLHRLRRRRPGGARRPRPGRPRDAPRRERLLSVVPPEARHRPPNVSLHPPASSTRPPRHATPPGGSKVRRPGVSSAVYFPARHRHCP